MIANDYSHMSPKGYNLEKYNNNMEKPTQLKQVGELSAENPEKPQPLRDNFRSYISNTTLHGFRYMAGSDMSWTERFWWMIMVAASIITCFYFIGKVWARWDANPVIVSFSHTSTSAWQVPFPAVTICTETKTNRTEFNLSRVYDEYRASPGMISPEDLQTFYDMLLVCNYPIIDSIKLDEGLYIANNSSIETIQRLAPTMDEIFLFCTWKKLKCADMFSHTLTKGGVCFTFNMLAEDEMFRMKNLHIDYHHVTGRKESSWSLGKGYSKDAPFITYPFRGPSHGGNDFAVVLLTNIKDLDINCRGPIQGFKIWLHNPAELPNMAQNFFRLPIGYQSAAAVIPKIVKTSENLLDYPPHKRNCFFPEERYLRFFKTYTERNCDLECASNHTWSRCGCVPFYMPHGQETQVCGPKSLPCILNATEILSQSKSALDLDEKDLRSKYLAESCNCLQACTELKYDVEVSQAVYHEDAFKQRNDDFAKKLKLPSGLVIYFAEELFASLERSELYGVTSFIASCGGIMGLFMGFSFLSLIELIYYVTIRLWCQVKRSRMVEAK